MVLRPSKMAHEQTGRLSRALWMDRVAISGWSPKARGRWVLVIESEVVRVYSKFQAWRKACAERGCQRELENAAVQRKRNALVGIVCRGRSMAFVKSISGAKPRWLRWVIILHSTYFTFAPFDWLATTVQTGFLLLHAINIHFANFIRRN